MGGWASGGVARATLALALLAETAFVSRRYPVRGVVMAIAVCAGLALPVWVLRVGTAGAALAGGLCCYALLLLRSSSAEGVLASAMPSLAALLLLTTAATRAGRQHKARLQAAESEGGRNAGQVFANLGVAALALALPFPWSAIAAVGALTESAADTLASEIGVLQRRNRVWLITGGWAAPGTDGGITLIGTAAGAAGALCVAGVAAATLPLGVARALACAAAGMAGCLIDSLLGATLERRGALPNNAVNFLSTLAAAALACALCAAIPDAR